MCLAGQDSPAGPRGAVLGAGNTCFLSARASLLQLSHVQVLLVGSVAPLSGGEGCPSY